MTMRAWPILSLLVLAGCIPAGRGPERRAPSRRPAVAQAAPAPALSDAALRQCQADLRRAGVSFQALPDRSFGGGCDATASVKLVAIGTPITNLGAMRCPLALAFSRWVSQVAQVEAERTFGQPLRRIESFGTYACRPVNGQAGRRLSEHAHANAVDISAFVLADGTRFTVKDGWGGEDERVRAYLRAVHDAGCRRFGVVLGPDANAYHRDHFHFDMASGGYCR
ncbi:extensin family protein [Sphingomonas arantia]|uniref:Extensin family protein n=1 Tax=Sphingomonas arantia TaxID=1460676 RepID=A0ABW4TTE7_9SPHN